MLRDRVRLIMLVVAMLAFVAGAASMALSVQAIGKASDNAGRIADNAQKIAQENQDRVNDVSAVAAQAQRVADQNRTLVCTFLAVIQAEKNGTESSVAGQMRTNFACGS